MASVYSIDGKDDQKRLFFLGYYFDRGCFRLIPFDCLRIIITNMNSITSKQYTCFLCNYQFHMSDPTIMSASRSDFLKITGKKKIV